MVALTIRAKNCRSDDHVAKRRKVKTSLASYIIDGNHALQLQQLEKTETTAPLPPLMGDKIGDATRSDQNCVIGGLEDDDEVVSRGKDLDEDE